MGMKHDEGGKAKQRERGGMIPRLLGGGVVAKEGGGRGREGKGARGQGSGVSGGSGGCRQRGCYPVTSLVYTRPRSCQRLGAPSDLTPSPTLSSHRLLPAPTKPPSEAHFHAHTPFSCLPCGAHQTLLLEQLGSRFLSTTDRRCDLRRGRRTEEREEIYIEEIKKRKKKEIFENQANLWL